MKLTGMRVKNFRTVGAQEQFVDLRHSLTIIGPNNSGKTNLLQAVQMFFTGHENTYAYSVDEDSPHGKGARTSIVGYFEGEPDGADGPFYDELDKLYNLYGIVRPGPSVTLYVTFSQSSSPTYAFFPNQKRPSDGSTQSAISRLQKALVITLLGQFDCHFIPSEKSMRELVDDVLTPFVRGVVVDVIEPLMDDIKSELAAVSHNINSALRSSGVNGIEASFGFHGGSLDTMLRGFDFYLSDPYTTRLDRKGQGIQSLAFMAALQWVTDMEAAGGRQSIWLIEEPESFLHPQLSHSATRLLAKLGESSTLVMTSHSMAFVPHDPLRVVGTMLDGEGCTSITTFKSHEKATVALRRGLGLRFADYFSLGTSTVLTEGQSDSSFLRWFLDLSADWQDCEWPKLRDATISDRGGASHLAGFVRANYEILRTEQPTVSLFDADDAGVKAVSDLSAYFSAIGVAFNPNREYVYVRNGFAIEGLFPDAWMLDEHTDNAAHFSTFQVDASGEVVTYRIKDNAKTSVGNRMRARAEQSVPSEWSGRWRDVCSALNGALERQAVLLAERPEAPEED
jgi:energy-coupling factor transporter ATP-binding protein EcfA2